MVPIHRVCLIFTITDALWDGLRVKENQLSAQKSFKRINYTVSPFKLQGAELVPVFSVSSFTSVLFSCQETVLEVISEIANS